MSQNAIPSGSNGAVSQASVLKLIAGEITPAQFLGLTRQVLYQMADVAYELLNSGKFDRAKEIYEGLVAADPNDSVFHCHLAAVHHRLGELDQALDQYSKALKFNRANIDALAGRGEIYLVRGELKRGIDDLAAAMALDPTFKRASTIRARALVAAIKKAAGQT